MTNNKKIQEMKDLKEALKKDLLLVKNEVSKELIKEEIEHLTNVLAYQRSQKVD